MSRPFYAVLLTAALMACAVLPVRCSRMPDVTSATTSGKEPRIDPDYTSLVIPPNIAPLNFRIMEDGRDYLVRISSDGGEKLEIHCRDGACRIPATSWRRLLETGKGGRGSSGIRDLFFPNLPKYYESARKGRSSGLV